MKKNFILLLLAPLFATAQDTLSLREAAELLAANNLSYRSKKLDVESSVASIQQARSALIPNLGISANQSFSFGRSIDQVTNTYINDNNNSTNYSIGGGVPLFNGFGIKNDIQRNKVLNEAALENQSAEYNNQMLLLLQNYTNVLATQAIYRSRKEQVNASIEQLDQQKKRLSAGTVPESNVYETQAQLALENFNLVSALNDYRLAKLAFYQLLNLAPIDSLQLMPLDTSNIGSVEIEAKELFAAASEIFPQIRSAELNITAANKAIAVAKSSARPSLDASGSFSTNFSSTNRDRNNGDMVIPYFDQLRDQRGSGLGLRLSIPILGILKNRPNVTAARVQEKVAKNQLDLARQQLYLDIETAVTTAIAASDQSKAATSSEQQLAVLLQMTQSRLNAGTASIFEYSQAKGNYVVAQANAIRARYDAVRQFKVLQFYRTGRWDGIL